MTDYIKRENALNAFNNAFYAGLTAKINKIPSEDVAPVRHGHWIFNQEDMTMTCSCCEDVYHFDDADLCLDFMEYAKYCLACGAKMDEVVDDESA